MEDEVMKKYGMQPNLNLSQFDEEFDELNELDKVAKMEANLPMKRPMTRASNNSLSLSKFESIILGSIDASVMEKEFIPTANLLPSPTNLTVKEKKVKDNAHFCFNCDRVFDRLNALKNHLLTHKSETCHLCGKTFNGSLKNHSAASRLKRHLQSTLCAKYQCDGCHENFRSKDKLHRHQGKCEASIKKCNKCRKIFKNRWYLGMHKCTKFDIPIEKGLPLQKLEIAQVQPALPVTHVASISPPKTPPQPSTQATSRRKQNFVPKCEF